MGREAVLIECAGRGVPAAVAERVRLEIAAVDVVPGAESVLVDGVADPAALIAVVESWETPSGSALAGPLVELPVVYDGADLAEVAALWGVTVEAAIARHREIEYVVEFCGFAPGFAYCAGLPKQWAVPRLESPRSRVPAGSVAVADVWTAVYPRATPGGWRILGTTDAELWRSERRPPALLAPGTRVRFVEA